jgi:uridine kinase
VQASDIAPALVALHTTDKTVLVAVDGAGGSGKSVFAESLWTKLNAFRVPACVVHVDDFYLPSTRRPRGGPLEKPIGSNFDWPRLRDQVLEPLRRGQTARYDRYDWVADAMANTHEVLPGQVVIVEGIYSSRRELAPLYKMRVWVECPRELRLSRGLKRDGETARGRWEDDWMPCEDRYIREHRPQEYADATVNGAAV